MPSLNKHNSFSTFSLKAYGTGLALQNIGLVSKGAGVLPTHLSFYLVLNQRPWNTFPIYHLIK